MTRKPSCLISCTQVSPLGGSGALVGRQDGTKPRGNQIWNMDITEQIGNGANLPTVPNSWSVAGIGNFVGNGLSDIVWHNANGQNLIWNIQNDQLVNGASLPTTPGAWSVAGIGQFLGNRSEARRVGTERSA